MTWLPDGYSQIFRTYVFGPSDFRLHYATLQHAGAIQGKEGIKFCHLATLACEPGLNFEIKSFLLFPLTPLRVLSRRRRRNLIPDFRETAAAPLPNTNHNLIYNMEPGNQPNHRAAPPSPHFFYQGPATWPHPRIGLHTLVFENHI